MTVIGTRAFLLQLPLPVLPLLVLLGVVALIVRSRKRQANAPSRTKAKVKGAIAVLMLALLAASGGFRLAHQMQYHSVLQNLKADSVDWIQVGSIRLDKPNDLHAVILVLRDNQGYEPTAGDGGRAQSADLVIHFKSGEEQRYPIARHLRYRGAVIDFISQGPHSGFVGHYGYALAEHLPDVLDQLGAHLPNEKKDGS